MSLLGPEGGCWAQFSGVDVGVLGLAIRDSVIDLLAVRADTGPLPCWPSWLWGPGPGQEGDCVHVWRGGSGQGRGLVCAGAVQDLALL